ncbi:hypothetical protein [Sorangium sp. So ce1335]|uniref:hypothetical protein n=1 Tax=Sorangium sp. So ce1335 TaxID=3133335 RepID=UPI003F617F79
MSAWKEPVRICIPTNVNATTSQVQNGVTLALNDRVLLMAQFAASQNGIWYVQSVAPPNVTLARAPDAAVLGDFIPGMSVCVGPEGTLYANTEWVLTSTGTDHIFKQRMFGPAKAPTVHASEQPGANAGEQIRNAILALPCTGGVVDARGITGNVEVTAPIVVDRPVTLLIGAATYTAKASASSPPTFADPMFDIQPNTTHCGSSRPNFTVVGLDPYASTFTTTIENGALFQLTGNFTGTIGRGRAVFVVEQMTLDGGNSGTAVVSGSTMVRTPSFPTIDFQDGLIRIEHNAIQNFGGTAIDLGDSVYVYRIHGNQFKLNASSVHIGLYGDGSIKENWFFQAPYSSSSGPTLTLLGPSVRVVNNYFFRAGIGDTVAEPDILLVPSSDKGTGRQAGGYSWILDNRFASERENFNKDRVRIKIRGRSGGAEDLTTVGGPLMVRGNLFLGGARVIASVSASTNVVTVTLKTAGVSDKPTQGLVAGDWVTITGVNQPQFNGVFKVTEVTDATFKYALTTPDASASGGVVTSAETFAIELDNPGFLHDISQNTFVNYANLIKDTQSRVDAIYGGSTFSDNHVVPPLGGGYREFVNEGREFTVTRPRPGSALDVVNGDARQVETRYLINRVHKSEQLGAWLKNGGIVVTPGEADPFGTTRAFKLTLGGTTNSQYIRSPVDIVNPSGALPTGTRLFITFWARIPAGSTPDPSSPDISTMVVALRDITDNTTAGNLFTVNLGHQWKKYKLVSNGIISGHTYSLLFYPGFYDRLRGEVAVCFPQVSEIDADYLPSEDTAGSVYDKTAGSRFEQAAVFTAIKTSRRAGTSAPGVSLGEPSELGTDGSVALVDGSTQVAGTIELTTGTADTSSSGSVIVTFVGSDYATGNAPVVIATLADGDAAWAATAQARISASSSGSFKVAWATNGAALATETTYRINYHVLA